MRRHRWVKATTPMDYSVMGIVYDVRIMHVQACERCMVLKKVFYGAGTGYLATLWRDRDGKWHNGHRLPECTAL